MEKYDYIVKSSEIRKLVEKRMYQKALQIIDTMDVNKVKVLADLSVFAEVYMQTERYDDAEGILLRLREKSCSRRIIYQLIKLSIKRRDEEDAEYYYDEFIKAAPRDADKFILRYRIDKMEGKDISVLIDSLTELKQYDYNEKWAFELAKLYHKAGMVDRCINECSDIILWFGEGVVVEKARMLREHYIGSESNRSEGTVTAEDKASIDFIEQEELELDDEVHNERVQREPHPVRQQVEEATKAAEEAVFEDDQSTLFATKDISNISQMLENYFEEEKQSMESATAEAEPEPIEEEVEPEAKEKPVEEEVEPEAKEEPVEEEVEAETEPVEEEEETEAEPIEEEEEAEAEPIEEEYVEEMPDTFKIESYQELFGRFYSIASVRLQVVTLVNDMLEEQMPYSFAIAGSSKSGKTTLGKSMIKLLYELNVFPYKKVAKINSEKLHAINLEENYERLQDGYLIVEEAGSLKPEDQLQIIRMLRDLRGRMLVILEDTQENLQALFHDYPMLNNYIQAVMKLEAYGKKELRDYAMNFFTEKKFALEEDAEIMLDVLSEQLVENEVAEERPEKLLQELHQIINHVEQRELQEVANGKGSKDADDSDICTIFASDFGNE